LLSGIFISVLMAVSKYFYKIITEYIIKDSQISEILSEKKRVNLILILTYMC